MSQSTTSSPEDTSSRATSNAESESVVIAKALDAVVAESDATGDGAIKLGLFWNEWARCIGSGYQSDSLYRHGRLDGCGKQWNDLKLAAEARLTQWRNPLRAEELINSTYYMKRTTISPTAGAIWELKERPGWD